mmetsp:Transcript_102451/g.330536  ORF Transcript_102451/g.330536 Transcript_102451/m.330536 type:complete len:215 (+) Transcript_102451:1053-1697(+)
MPTRCESSGCCVAGQMTLPSRISWPLAGEKEALTSPTGCWQKYPHSALLCRATSSSSSTSATTSVATSGHLGWGGASTRTWPPSAPSHSKDAPSRGRAEATVTPSSTMATRSSSSEAEEAADAGTGSVRDCFCSTPLSHSKRLPRVSPVQACTRRQSQLPSGLSASSRNSATSPVKFMRQVTRRNWPPQSQTEGSTVSACSARPSVRAQPRRDS